MKRVELLTNLFSRFDKSTYLEVGVFDGENFRKMKPARAIAVDPEPNMPPEETSRWKYSIFSVPRRCYVQKTSDEFFLRPHRWVRKYGIDVAFIDGLHTAEQVFVDVKNTLRWLNPMGFIVLHDTNPLDAGMAYPAESFEKARADYRAGLVEDWSWQWCGDVWKAVMRIRMEMTGLRVYTLADDYGLTVIWRDEEAKPWPGPGRPIDGLVYKDLAANREDWLNITSDQDLVKLLSASAFPRSKRG